MEVGSAWMGDFFVQSMLQQLPYFAHAAGLTISELAQQAVHCTFVPNEMIFLEGEPSAGLWIVEDGRVKVYELSPDGQEYILRFFGPGDTFNDLAALDDAPTVGRPPRPVSICLATLVADLNGGLPFRAAERPFLNAAGIEKSIEPFMPLSNALAIGGVINPTAVYDIPP